LGYHMGKILECGALCCEPGTTKDCMLGLLEDGSFTVWSPNPARRCTPVSVAAHTFYEKSHPYELPGPGTLLDLRDCSFTDAGEGKVRVAGSRLRHVPYTVKLEGARKTAYRTFVIAGIRDPLLISRLDEVERGVEESVRSSYLGILPERYHIRFMHYGIDAVMGPLEPDNTIPHEVGLLFEVVADTQELADAVCASVRSTYLHYGYEGRKSTAGNLAFPFAPSDVSFGPVYEFSVYHLLHIDSPTRLFPMERFSWEKAAAQPTDEGQER
ncbi:MAG TPA: acyclic terpene utilization AtuA family protein, partial [Candidatus Limiplasma sp.]|nr:acyclic terpene utilization AtuA family protein [Candidatus Limiplasma sp.]